MLRMPPRVPEFPWATLLVPAGVLAAFISAVVYIDGGHNVHTTVARWLIANFMVLEFVVVGSGLVALLGVAWGLGAMRRESAAPGVRHWVAMAYGVLHLLLVVLFLFTRTVY
jgi:hypothetical protein